METLFPWFIAVAGLAIAAAAAIIGFSTHIKPGWTRICSRVLAAIFSVPMFLGALLSFLMVGCYFDGPLSGSPDGRHVARVQVTDTGAIGHPSAQVVVRRSWQPTWQIAYTGIGWQKNGRVSSPILRWLDNSHLLITYLGGFRYPIDCFNKLSDVIVQCEVDATLGNATH